MSWQPEGNYYNKYEARNPIGRLLMANFLRAFDELSRASKASTTYEVGCGEGHLSFRLAKRGMRVHSCDVSERLIEDASEKAKAEGLPARFECASIYDLTPKYAGAELVVCCEVLEHLEAPEYALDVLAGISRPYLLASVPREPLWRVLNMARGAYWREWGNTPGHIQHWSFADFLEFLATRFEVLEVRTPLPWTMVLCRTRSGSRSRSQLADSRSVAF